MESQQGKMTENHSHAGYEEKIPWWRCAPGCRATGSGPRTAGRSPHIHGTDLLYLGLSRRDGENWGRVTRQWHMCQVLKERTVSQNFLCGRNILQGWRRKPRQYSDKRKLKKEYLEQGIKWKWHIKLCLMVETKIIILFDVVQNTM